MLKLVIYGAVLFAIMLFFKDNPMMMYLVFGIIIFIVIYPKFRKRRSSGGSIFRKGGADTGINENIIKLMLFTTILNQNQSQPLKLVVKNDGQKKESSEAIKLQSEKSQILCLFKD